MTDPKRLFSGIDLYAFGDAGDSDGPASGLGQDELVGLRALAARESVAEDAAESISFMNLLPGDTSGFVVPATLDDCLEVGLTICTVHGLDGWARILKASLQQDARRASEPGFKPEFHTHQVERSSLQNRLLHATDKLLRKYAEQTNAVLQPVAVDYALHLLDVEQMVIQSELRRYFWNGDSLRYTRNPEAADLVPRDKREMLKIRDHSNACHGQMELFEFTLKWLPFVKPGDVAGTVNAQSKERLHRYLTGYGYDDPVIWQVYRSKLAVGDDAEAANIVAKAIGEALLNSLQANAEMVKTLQSDPDLVWKFGPLIDQTCRNGVGPALALQERSFAYQAALYKAGLPPRMTHAEIAQLAHFGMNLSLGIVVFVRAVALSNPVGWAIYALDVLLAIYRIAELAEESELQQLAHDAVLTPTRSIARAPDWASTYIDILAEAFSFWK